MATTKEEQIEKELAKKKEEYLSVSEDLKALVLEEIRLLTQKLDLEKQINAQRKENISSIRQSIEQLTEERNQTQDKKEAAKLDLEIAKKRLEYSKEYLKDLEKQGKKENETDEQYKKRLEKAKRILKTRQDELSAHTQTNQQLKEEEERLKSISLLSEKVLSTIGTISGEYGRQIGQLFSINGLFSTFGSMITEVVDANQKLVASTGKVGLLTADMAKGFEQYGVGFAEMAEATATLRGEMSDFSKLGNELRTSLSANAAMMKRFDISTSTTAKSFNNLTKSLKFGADEVANINNIIMRTGIAVGITPAKMAKDFETYMPKLASHGKKAVDVFLDLQKQSKYLGMEIDTLMGIVGDTFDKFDSGAEATGRLNAILGGDYLNSVEMLNATESERVEMLKRSFEMSGKNWEALDRYEKKAIATSLGIKDVNEASKLFGNTTAEMRAEMTKQAASQKELEEALKNATPIMRQLQLAFDELLTAAAPVAKMIKEFATWLAGDTAGAGAFKFAAGLIAIGRALQGLYIFSGLQALIGGFGKTAAVAGTEAAGGITAIGGAATSAAGGLLALGGAIALVGVGIGAAALGMAELVKAFAGLNGEQIWGAISAIGVASLAMIAITGILYSAAGAMAVAGVAGAAAAPGLLLLGGAIALIGAGIGAAAYGMSTLVQSITELTSKTLNLSNLTGISSAIAEITKSIMDMPDTVEFKAKISNLKTVGDTLQVAAESAPYIAPAQQFVVAAKEYHIAQKDSKATDNDALVAAIKGITTTSSPSTSSGIKAGTPVIIKIENGTDLRGMIMNPLAIAH